MPRLILICAFAATLGACATQSSNADLSSDANKNTWAHENLACADVGITPGSPTFDQCVADLHQSIWVAHNLDRGN
jgi:hypothetical protein